MLVQLYGPNETQVYKSFFYTNTIFASRKNRVTVFVTESLPRNCNFHS